MNRELNRTRYIFILLMLFVSLSIAACGSRGAEPSSDDSAQVNEEAQSDGSTANDANAEEPTAAPVVEAEAEESAAEPAESDNMVVEEIEGVTTDSGLQFIEVEAGDGDKPQVGDLVEVHYTGKLTDGTQFDSSVGRQPFGFLLGTGSVIAGWDEGIALLNEGGRAMLIIPPDLAYGERDLGTIPANSTLMFDVALVNNYGPPPIAPTEIDAADFVETDSGLNYFDFEIGDGDTPASGDIVSVHYSGWLTDGTKFDSSFDRASPISFALGQGQVIPGWDEGLSTMQVGGKRQLVIPPDLAYGEAGYSTVIPGDSTLIFEVQLVDIQAQE